MAFNKYDAERLYKKLRAREPNVSGALGTPPSGSAVGAVGDVVLATGAGTTTDVLDARITNTTFMELAPADLYGSAEKGAGNIFWSSPADGIMRITHTASTKTRTFKYLLMFALALLLASASWAQVIEEDGTPLEVTPALNFGPGILCALGVDVIDCDVYGVLAGGDVMLASEWATLLGYPYVDQAVSALCLDRDSNGLCEVYWSVASLRFDADGDGTDELIITPMVSIFFDVNEDGTAEVNTTATTAGFFTGGADGSVINSSGIATFGGQVQSEDGFRTGNGSAIGLAQSVCNGRDAAVDKLFEDTDCDFSTAGSLVPETTPSTTSNAEAFYTDMQRRLSADVSTDGAGGANDTTGIQATGLKLDLDWIGAYWIEYQIISRSSVAGDGIKYGVEYTGTETSLYCHRTHLNNSFVGASDLAIDVNAAPATLVEGYAAAAASTTAPNMGPNAGGFLNTNPTLEFIRCNLLTTTAGDLTLHFASEVDGTAVTVKANSMVKATPFP